MRKAVYILYLIPLVSLVLWSPTIDVVPTGDIPFDEAQVAVEANFDAVSRVVMAARTAPLIRGELKTICACESVWDPDAEPVHFKKNGAVLVGFSGFDIGKCQINEPTWGWKAIELGYDIYKERGNELMANWIYDRHGTEPWKRSLACWGESVARSK